MKRKTAILKAYKSNKPAGSATPEQLWESEYLNYLDLCHHTGEVPTNKEVWLNQIINSIYK